MRGADDQAGSMFRYVSLEARMPPERLLRALLLQALYTVRSARRLMEQLDDNLLFRWFVGLGMDDAVWSPTTLTKNRDRLRSGDIATAFFDAVLIHADTARLLSDDHFTVDGTLLEAWAGQKSFESRDQDAPEGGGSNPAIDFHGQRWTNAALVMIEAVPGRHRVTVAA